MSMATLCRSLSRLLHAFRRRTIRRLDLDELVAATTRVKMPPASRRAAARFSDLQILPGNSYESFRPRTQYHQEVAGAPDEKVIAKDYPRDGALRDGGKGGRIYM